MEKIDEKLFLEMKRLINEGNEEEFLFFISKNDYLLKIDPILFIGNHVSFYAEKENVTKALEVVSYYKNAPYISMEVEDFLNELKEELTFLTQTSSKEYDEMKIRKMLFSSNEEAIASSLGFLAKQNIRNYIPLMQDYLLSEVPYKYKTLALFILVEQKVSAELKVSKNDRIYTYNPSKLAMPFEDVNYLNCRKSIVNLASNRVDVLELANELLNTTQIKMFPDSLIDEYDYVLYSDIFLHLARMYMQEDVDLDALSSKYNLEKEELHNKIKEINKILLD